MHPRLQAEWAELDSAYPGVQHHEQPERVEVEIDLDGALFTPTRTRVAVLIPPGYPNTGPDGFLVPAGLQMTGGLPAGDASGAGMPGWLLVSFHMFDANGQSTWKPTADPGRGDNVIGYLCSIESFLARGCN